MTRKHYTPVPAGKPQTTLDAKKAQGWCLSNDTLSGTPHSATCKEVYKIQWKDVGKIGGKEMLRQRPTAHLPKLGVDTFKAATTLGCICFDDFCLRLLLGVL